MASKTNASTAGRSDPTAVIQGIPAPKINRALGWIERLLAAVQILKRRAQEEQSYYCFTLWDRRNAAIAKAVTSSLKSIGYAGEAGMIRCLYSDLAGDCRDMLIRSYPTDPADPAHVPVSEYGMAYMVGAGTYDVARLEAALLEVQTEVRRLISDAGGGGKGKTAAALPAGKKAGVNARMLETIQKDTAAMGWNSPQWAKHLKCAKSSVVATPAWTDLKMGRERAKAERAKDRRRRARGSDRKRD
jgi:hypothetical protein